MNLIYYGCISFATVVEKQKANLEVVHLGLKEMGLKGLIEHLVKKR